MWGKKQREEKIERLAEAVDRAEAALAAGGRADLELMLAELSDALIEAPLNPTDISSFDPHLEDLRRRAWHVRQQLEGDVVEQRDRQVLPCARCGGREILVCDEPSADPIQVRDRVPRMAIHVSVCRACGDVRMTADPAEAAALVTSLGERAFRTVVVDEAPGRGPYR